MQKHMRKRKWKRKDNLMLSDLLRKMTIALIMMLVSIPALLIIFIYNLVDYIKNIKDYEKRE